MSDDRAVLIDIAGACQLIADFIRNHSQDDFYSDLLTQSTNSSFSAKRQLA
jgi:hypothetical protein